MNGLILIKTFSPLHLFLNKFLGYQSVGFLVDGKIFLFDEFGLYEHNFSLGVDLEIFKHYYPVESLQIKLIKNGMHWERCVRETLGECRISSIKDIIFYLVKNNKIKNISIHNVDVIHNCLVRLSKIINDINFESWFGKNDADSSHKLDNFGEWKELLLPERPALARQLKYQELCSRHKPNLNLSVNIMIDLMIENPKYFVNPYQMICQMLLEQIDLIVLKEKPNLDKIAEIRRLYKNIESL